MSKKLGIFQTDSLRRDKYGNYSIYEPCKLCGQARWVKKGDKNSRCKICANRESGLRLQAENAPNWRGGRLVYGGVVLIFVKPSNLFFCMIKNPSRDTAGNLLGGHIPEHRLKMAEHIGRPLRSNEVVHHLNGISADNRIENLELHSSHGSHIKTHWNNGTFRNRKKSQTPVWNKGLTKETDERVARTCRNNSSHFAKGNSPWNTGLTRETDARLEHMARAVSVALMDRKLSEQHRSNMKGRTAWNRGLRNGY